jgi:membrane peptidoglycan carboxypeptidase
VQYGTGTAAALPDRPAAGKTGTTEHFSDAWFNGYTPQLATSIWMGDPKARTSMTNVGGITVFGGTYPARIWHAYTLAALKGQKAIDFPAPDPRKIPRGRPVTSASLLRDAPRTINPFATTTTTVKKTTTTTSPPGPPPTSPPTTPPSTRPPPPTTTTPTTKPPRK